MPRTARAARNILATLPWRRGAPAMRPPSVTLRVDPELIAEVRELAGRGGLTEALNSVDDSPALDSTALAQREANAPCGDEIVRQSDFSTEAPTHPVDRLATARTPPQPGHGMRERCTSEIPEKVRRNAALMGKPGQIWLANLPQQIAELERRWAIKIEQPVQRSSEAFVALCSDQ
jgi:hypothetical protein